jgi:phage replication-related protein YjqB (UPF0714/DUF867 family)
MHDRYTSYAELARGEKRDVDYTIIHREAASDLAVMAPHGGGIEPGTVDVADAVAAGDHTFYAFKGLKARGNAVLHINSNRFDEPVGVQAAAAARVAVTIHGSRDMEAVVHVGGKNRVLKERIVAALNRAGFQAAICETPGLRGIQAQNICNRCRSGAGVQLEISRGMREKLFENLHHRSLRKKTVLFYRFVEALREVLRA